MSDSSADNAEEDIEQMRHSWPQTPRRRNLRYGVPLVPRPELYVEVARRALRREPPPPPNPVHATLYPALSVEEPPASVLNDTLHGEQEPVSREDAPPPSPFLIALSSDDSESHGISLLSEVGVQWLEPQWDAPREAIVSSSSGRSPMDERWDDLEEGEIRE